jgi:hypothetical protein
MNIPSPNRKKRIPPKTDQTEVLPSKLVCLIHAAIHAKVRIIEANIT